MIEFNCKDCKDRHIGCHSTCEEYQEIKKRRSEVVKKYRLERESDSYYFKEKARRLRF